MKQRTEPRFTLALLAAFAAVTCAKAEDHATDGTGGGGSNSGGTTTSAATSAGLQNTTTLSTASNATATNGTSATSATSGGTSNGTTGAGNQGGEAGAPNETTGSGGGSGGNGDGGNGGSSTETSTDGVPPDVIENASVVLLYKIDSSTATTASIFMHLYLRNQSDDPFPLGAAEVRYWLDDDGRGYTMASHYQGPGIGAVTLSKGSVGDDDYVAVNFGAGKNLAANTGDINPNEFQVKLDASGGSFDQSDDYSFEPSYTTPTEHDRITVYLADELVWGCEPSGACAGDDPGAGGAAGAAGAAGAEG